MGPDGLGDDEYTRCADCGRPPSTSTYCIQTGRRHIVPHGVLPPPALPRTPSPPLVHPHWIPPPCKTSPPRSRSRSPASPSRSVHEARCAVRTPPLPDGISATLQGTTERLMTALNDTDELAREVTELRRACDHEKAARTRAEEKVGQAADALDALRVANENLQAALREMGQLVSQLRAENEALHTIVGSTDAGDHVEAALQGQTQVQQRLAEDLSVSQGALLDEQRARMALEDEVAQLHGITARLAEEVASAQQQYQEALVRLEGAERALAASQGDHPSHTEEAMRAALLDMQGAKLRVDKELELLRSAIGGDRKDSSQYSGWDDLRALKGSVEALQRALEQEQAMRNEAEEELARLRAKTPPTQEAVGDVSEVYAALLEEQKARRVLENELAGMKEMDSKLAEESRARVAAQEELERVKSLRDDTALHAALLEEQKARKAAEEELRQVSARGDSAIYQALLEEQKARKAAEEELRQVSARGDSAIYQALLEEQKARKAAEQEVETLKKRVGTATAENTAHHDPDDRHGAAKEVPHDRSPDGSAVAALRALLEEEQQRRGRAEEEARRLKANPLNEALRNSLAEEQKAREAAEEELRRIRADPNFFTEEALRHALAKEQKARIAAEEELRTRHGPDETLLQALANETRARAMVEEQLKAATKMADENEALKAELKRMEQKLANTSSKHTEEALRQALAEEQKARIGAEAKVEELTQRRGSALEEALANERRLREEAEAELRLVKEGMKETPSDALSPSPGQPVSREPLPLPPAIEKGDEALHREQQLRKAAEDELRRYKETAGLEGSTLMDALVKEQRERAALQHEIETLRETQGALQGGKVCVSVATDPEEDGGPLHDALLHEQQHRASLETELHALRAHGQLLENELQALKQQQAALEGTEGTDEGGSGDPSHASTAAALERALAHEQQARAAAEEELRRLKEKATGADDGGEEAQALENERAARYAVEREFEAFRVEAEARVQEEVQGRAEAEEEVRRLKERKTPLKTPVDPTSTAGGLTLQHADALHRALAEEQHARTAAQEEVSRLQALLQLHEEGPLLEALEAERSARGGLEAEVHQLRTALHERETAYNREHELQRALAEEQYIRHAMEEELARTRAAKSMRDEQTSTGGERQSLASQREVVLSERHTSHTGPPSEVSPTTHSDTLRKLPSLPSEHFPTRSEGPTGDMRYPATPDSTRRTPTGHGTAPLTQPVRQAVPGDSEADFISLPAPSHPGSLPCTPEYRALYTASPQELHLHPAKPGTVRYDGGTTHWGCQTEFPVNESSQTDRGHSIAASQTDPLMHPATSQTVGTSSQITQTDLTPHREWRHGPLSPHPPDRPNPPFDAPEMIRQAMPPLLYPSRPPSAEQLQLALAYEQQSRALEQLKLAASEAAEQSEALEVLAVERQTALEDAQRERDEAHQDREEARKEREEAERRHEEAVREKEETERDRELLAQERDEVVRLREEAMREWEAARKEREEVRMREGLLKPGGVKEGLPGAQEEGRVELTEGDEMMQTVYSADKHYVADPFYDDRAAWERERWMMEEVRRERELREGAEVERDQARREADQERERRRKLEGTKERPGRECGDTEVAEVSERKPSHTENALSETRAILQQAQSEFVSTGVEVAAVRKELVEEKERVRVMQSRLKASRSEVKKACDQRGALEKELRQAEDDLALARAELKKVKGELARRAKQAQQQQQHQQTAHLPRAVDLQQKLEALQRDHKSMKRLLQQARQDTSAAIRERNAALESQCSSERALAEARRELKAARTEERPRHGTPPSSTSRSPSTVPSIRPPELPDLDPTPLQRVLHETRHPHPTTALHGKLSDASRIESPQVSPPRRVRDSVSFVDPITGDMYHIVASDWLPGALELTVNNEPRPPSRRLAYSDGEVRFPDVGVTANLPVEQVHRLHSLAEHAGAAHNFPTLDASLTREEAEQLHKAVVIDVAVALAEGK